MRLLLDSFWRAIAYLLHPKVIGLSLLPLVVGAALAVGLGWLYWEPAVAFARATLEQWSLLDGALRWVEGFLGSQFRAVVAPLLVVTVAAPAIVLLSVLLVSVLMAPAVVSLIAARRFPTLERRHGAGVATSVAYSLGTTLVAFVLLVLSLPLWLIPPLVLILPPLIWGWLTYKVMAFDSLADHADAAERRRVLAEHRMPLWTIGIVSGYLGAAPSLLWAAGALTLVFAPVLVALSIWLYTLVFAFSALWIAHYALAALAALRGERDVEAVPVAPPAGGVPTVVPAAPTGDRAAPGVYPAAGTVVVVDDPPRAAPPPPASPGWRP